MSIKAIKECYNVRCKQVFANPSTAQIRCQPDEETHEVSMQDYIDCYRSIKFDMYDLSDVDASG